MLKRKNLFPIENNNINNNDNNNDNDNVISGEEFPDEIWEMIVSMIDEHFTLIRLSMVNKRLYSICNQQKIWENLFYFAWPSKRLKKSNPKEKFKMVLNKKSKNISIDNYRECYHCGGKHKMYSITEWRKKVPEHKEFYCPCPDCPTSSWLNCSWHSYFMK